MTVPGGDSGENPQANADQPRPEPNYGQPDQGVWPYPPGFDAYPGSAPGYPQPGYAPPGYGGPADYYSAYSAPGYGVPPGTPGSPGYPGYPSPTYDVSPGGYPPSYGAPSYGAPYGYPGPGYITPYPGSYSQPGMASAKTNALATTSLVLSLIAVVFWPVAIIGIVLGVVALNQIKKTGEGGHRLAIAGTAVGTAVLLLGMLYTMSIG